MHNFRYYRYVVVKAKYDNSMDPNIHKCINLRHINSYTKDIYNVIKCGFNNECYEVVKKDELYMYHGSVRFGRCDSYVISVLKKNTNFYRSITHIPAGEYLKCFK